MRTQGTWNILSIAGLTKFRFLFFSYSSMAFNTQNPKAIYLAEQSPGKSWKVIKGTKRSSWDDMVNVHFFTWKFTTA